MSLASVTTLAACSSSPSASSDACQRLIVGAAASAGEPLAPVIRTVSNAKAARVCADRHRGRHQRRSPTRAAGADAHDSRRAGDGRAVPRAGVGGQRGDARSSCCATRADAGKARLHYFLINKGPWSRLDHNEPFVPGRPPSRRRPTTIRPARPKRKWRSGFSRLPAAEKARATGFFTTIRRGPDGRLRRRAVQHRVPGRARDSPRCTCARRRS